MNDEEHRIQQVENIETEYEDLYDKWFDNNKDEIIRKYRESEESQNYYFRNYGQICTEEEESRYEGWYENLDIDDVPMEFILELFEAEHGNFVDFYRERIKDPENLRKYRLINVIGYVGETWIRNKYLDQGYKVEKVAYTRSTWIRKGQIKNLLKDYRKCDEIIELLEELKSGLPDLICLKDTIISFIEIKTNGGALTKRQKETFQKIKDKGYDITIEKVNISNFKIEETGNMMF